MVKRASFSLPESALQGFLSALVCDLVMTLNSYAVRDAKWGLHRVVMATGIEPLAQDLHTNSQAQYRIYFFTFFRGSRLEGWIFFSKTTIDPTSKSWWNTPVVQSYINKKEGELSCCRLCTEGCSDCPDTGDGISLCLFWAAVTGSPSYIAHDL